MRTLSLATLALLTVTALPAIADDCRFSTSLAESVDTTGATLVRIDAKAGFLRVEGRAGASEVRAEGTACASRESDLDAIRIGATRHGDEVRIEAIMPDDSFGWNHSASLDLTIEVPAEIALDIEDGSGEIRIRNVGGVELEDGSGEIDISKVHGDIWLRDGSGEIEIRNVDGKLTIDEDGSGEITIVDVTGDVEIREDGSGGIEIRRVGGGVLVGEDGSGSIRVDGVEGDFIVERDGSGGISVDDVAGRVRLPADD